MTQLEGVGGDPGEVTQLEGVTRQNGDTDQEDEDPNNCFWDHEEDITAADEHLLAQKSTALLLLTLKERHRLTQVAVNFSVGQMKQMVLHVLDDVKTSVKKKMDADSTADIDECFDVNPFQGLETEYLQTKFYQKHFNLVVSSHL